MGRSCFLKKGDVYTKFTMPIFCVSPNSIISLSFRCWSIPVSEIREFNRKKEKEKKEKEKKEKKKKKKMNNSKSDYFDLTPFPQSKWTHFLAKLSF